MKYRRAAAAAGLVLALGLAVACSPAANDGGGEGDSKGKTLVTFRLWDQDMEKAYKKSFQEFEKKHKDIKVETRIVAWNDYARKLNQDIKGGNMEDVFWVNTSQYGQYADNGSLIDVGKELGDQRADWKESIVGLYTRNDTVWGVPQQWDSIALYYNKKLVDAARVKVDDLRWDPAGGAGDTLVPAAKKLTKGGVWGFNAGNDPQGIYWDFVGSNGGAWQDGDQFAMDDPKTVAAMQYVVDLINKHKVAPPAADTNDGAGDKTKELFLRQKVALFQSGSYTLKSISEGAKFPWSVAPMPEGPAGRVGVVHGVAAVGNAKSPHKEATLEVLKWLGSAEGQRPIAAGGYSFPGVTSIESEFVAYWKRKGVDLKPFLSSASGTTFPAPIGPKVQAGSEAMESTIKATFLGRKPVAAAMKEAQKLGNDAISD